MNVLDMFLRDMEIETDYVDEGNICTVDLTGQVFEEIRDKINHNAYYYNKSNISLNSIKMRLRDYDLGCWIQYNLIVERIGDRIKITCTLVGYETILPSGAVGLSDSIQTKNRLEM